MNDSSDSLVAAGFRANEGGAGNQVATRRTTEVAAPAPLAAESSRFDVADLLRIWHKWKWLILGVTAGCILLSILMTVTTTRLYRSSAMIQINTDSQQYLPDERGAGARQARQDLTFLQTQYGLLASRSLAERVARTLNLGADPNFVGRSGQRAAGDVAAANRLMSGLTVTPQRGSSLIEITYTDTDPQRAATIVNAFARGFIDSGIERRFQNSSFARDFLQNRLASTRSRLEDSERALVAYARQANILSLDNGGGGGSGGSGGSQGGGGGGGGTTSGDTLSAQSLISFNTALAQATRDRIEAEQVYRQALANGSAGDTSSNGAIQTLRSQRAALDADYQQRLSTFRPDYPDMVALRQRIASLDRSIAAENGNAATALRAAYEAARGREQQLLAQVNSYRGNVLDLRNRGIQYNILQRDVETNRTLYNALLQRYKEIGISGGIGDAEASVVDGGDVPRGPFRPRPILNLVIGILAGLVLGFGAAFAIEFIDDTIKSPEDVLRKLQVPAIGLVPRAPAGSSVVDELRDQRSEVAEAYFTIVSSLQYVAGSHGFPRSLLVTSSRAAEGKSSTSLAIAQNLARIGARTLLIDADMRKPSFKSPGADKLGLSSLLASTNPAESAIVRTSTANLWLLPSGPIPPSPAELLSTGRISALLSELGAAYDVIIVDAPPVLGLADAPILSAICEATLMVIEAGKVRRSIVLSSLRRLTASNARIAGAVLTKFNAKSAGYGYGYGYGYGRTGSTERYGDHAPARQLDISEAA